MLINLLKNKQTSKHKEKSNVNMYMSNKSDLFNKLSI